MSSVRPHTRWPIAVVIGVIGSLVVALVVLAFLWPTKSSAPHHLPIGIVGPAATVDAFESALDVAGGDSLELVEASDREAAVAQIEERTTFGAVVFGGAGVAPEVLTAPAASTVTAQLMNGVAAQLQAQLVTQVTAAGGDPASAAVTVTPVVEFSDADPTGSGLVAAAFPLTMGGMLGGILVSLLVVGVIRRLVALAGFAIATGLVLTLILQTWFGFLQGPFLLNALAVAMSVLATSAFIVGCTSLIGRPGIAIGAVVTMLVGNPLGAAAVPWQFVVEPWGAIGQLLVPGASNTLIRSLSYFPDADTSAQWWVLVLWAVVGLVLAIAGHFRSRASMRLPAGTLESADAGPAPVPA